MSYYITGKGPCQCQPDEGDYCPHSSEVAALQSELTAARDEAERLRERVAELVEYVDGPGELAGDYNWEMLKADTNTSQAWLLRKQAEAVEAEAGRWLKDARPGFGYSREFIERELTAYAKRLRHQADEAEKAGG